MTAPSASRTRLNAVAMALVLCAAAGLFAARSTAPHNFLDKDQERPASYILDILRNGNWICQTDWMGDITSKPPMLTWIGALVARAAGGVSPLTLFLPSAAAMSILALLLCIRGGRAFGTRAGLAASLAFLLATLPVQLFILLRTDAVFSLMVGLTAFAAYDAWISGRGWPFFWLLAALATLTKGPLGLVLGAGGLLAALWERKGGNAPSLRGGHAGGIVIYLALVVGWFLLAYGRFGDALVDKVIRRELVAHAVNIENAYPLWQRIFKPGIYYVLRNLPWSLFALAGFLRVILRPAADPAGRRFERFLFCWFTTGLAITSVTQHQRPDLLAPILAPAALLAGREVAIRTRQLSTGAFFGSAAALITASLIAVFGYYHFLVVQEPLVVQTGALRNFAREFKERGGTKAPTWYFSAPYTFQLYLGTMVTNNTFEEVTAILTGTNAAYVVTGTDGALMIRDILDPAGERIYTVATCDVGGETILVILGNRPDLPTPQF